MLFNSVRFLVFFLLLYGLFLAIRKQVLTRTLYLLAFSLYFYYLSSGWYFLLLILSTLIDFSLGHLIYSAKTQRRSLFWLWVSIAANLGILGYFKYTHFLINSANAAFGLDWSFHKIFLPVGISFFTFQTMSYSIDVYRRKIVPLTAEVSDLPSFFRQLSEFAFFVSFFPQLVAGPIVRAAEFIPQIRSKLTLTRADLSRAVLLLSAGLFKKAIISDYISVNFVDRIFDTPAQYSGIENLLAAYGYAIQIYCDFSGYSDMAIGLALLMGYRLPDNFNLPYRADTIRDFWRRWHISLSTWLKDYLYISLGGNRKGRLRTYFNLMVTMLLGGLWHGASWVFVIWGGLHGAALAIDRWLESLGRFFKRKVIRIAAIMGGIQAGGYVWIWWAAADGTITATAAGQANGVLTYIAIAWVGATALLVLTESLLRKGEALSRPFSVLLVFHFVTLCWIFFRSGALNAVNPPLTTTGSMLMQILTAFQPGVFAEMVGSAYGPALLLIAIGYLLHFRPLGINRLVEARLAGAPFALQALLLALVIWGAIQMAGSGIVPFIYFQF